MAKVETKYDYPRNDIPIAAPPDDGGHLGSFTQPQDVLMVPESQRAGAGPMLQYTNAFPKRRVDAPVTGLVLIIAALVLGLVTAFWITMM